jgi:hypothetical protein
MASVILLFSVAISGQEMTQEEKKREAILNHPTNLKVELARRRPEPYDPPDEAARPFKPSENIYFELVVTSNLPDPIEVQSFNRYYQNRPELFHDGEPVAYLKDIAKSLASTDAHADYERFIETTTLLPATPTKAGKLELRDWYETLKPGRYRLVNRHRFIFGGDWVETSPISFEVQK